MLPPSAYHKLRIIVEVEIAPDDVEAVRAELASTDEYQEANNNVLNKYLYDAESALYSQEHKPRLVLVPPDVKKRVYGPTR